MIDSRNREGLDDPRWPHSLLDYDSEMFAVLSKGSHDFLFEQADSKVMQNFIKDVVERFLPKCSRGYRERISSIVGAVLRQRWNPPRARDLIANIHFVCHRVLSCASVFILVFLGMNAVGVQFQDSKTLENNMRFSIAIFVISVVVICVVDRLHERNAELRRLHDDRTRLSGVLRDAFLIAFNQNPTPLHEAKSEA